MDGHPAELYVLALLMVLAGSLWMPYVVGIATDPSQEDAFGRPADLSRVRPWVHRAHRAHLNLLEQAMPFAVLVLIVNAVNGFSMLTYWAALAFLCIRLIHAAGMISGVARMPVRPTLFLAGWLCCLAMAYAVFVA